MMPRIDAGERLAAIGDGHIAAGLMRQHEAGRMIRRLEETAGGPRAPRAKATPAVLARMGIGVTAPPAPAEKGLNDG